MIPLFMFDTYFRIDLFGTFLPPVPSLLANLTLWEIFDIAVVYSVGRPSSVGLPWLHWPKS